MGSEWPEYRLGEVTYWSSGGTPPKNDESYWNGDIPWISASSMSGNRYNKSKLRITQKGLKSGSRLATEGTILLLVRGSMLHKRIPVGIAERDVSFNQDVKAIKAIDSIVDPWFLLFWFMSRENDLLGMVENTGIGAGKLDTTLLQNMVIRIPPLNEREAIVAFAKALDDKIELNRRMNATLEGMAQALFKSWFVDFDPVLDNALVAGNPIPEELAERAEVRRQALADGTANREAAKQFPAAFQLSEEMGWIPVGWEVKTSSSLFDVRDGTHDSPKQSTTGKYLITSRHITGNTIDYSNAYLISEEDFEQANKRSKVDPYDILLTMIGTVGSPFLVMEEEINFAIKNVGLFKSGVNRTLATYFFTYLKSDFMTAFMESRLAGTTQKYLTLKILRTLPIPVPHSDIMKEFGNQTLPIFDKIHLNNSTTNSLVALRDTLLPKLISGELRIPKAEKLAEEAMA